MGLVDSVGDHLVCNLGYDEIKIEAVPVESRILGQMACSKGN